MRSATSIPILRRLLIILGWSLLGAIAYRASLEHEIVKLGFALASRLKNEFSSKLKFLVEDRDPIEPQVVQKLEKEFKLARRITFQGVRRFLIRFKEYKIIPSFQ